MKRHGRHGDRLMETMVYAAGGTVAVIVLAILGYLVSESRYAFNRKFDFGYKFALQPASGPGDNTLEFDPNASLLTCNREGSDDAPDEKEELTPIMESESLAGMQTLVTATTLKDGWKSADAAVLYRDEWRGMTAATKKQTFTLVAFATPDYSEDKMVLAWGPDNAFNPALSPFHLKLKMVQAPEGVDVDPVEVDLSATASGSISLPTYVAANDSERAGAYVFEMTAEPAPSHAGAVAGGWWNTLWDPTLSYPSFGVIPLFVGTISITLLALLFATPISLATALYLSDIASPRLREVLKPVIELISSVPTVVLGYFGLMLLAPQLQATFAKALGLESGRALLTTSLIMAVLLIPTIVSVAEDALANVPKSMRDGGEALGLLRFEMLRKIVVPAAGPGLISAVLLGMARAVGETMIVWILSGGTPTMPSFNGAKDAAANLMRPTSGIPDRIAIEMGNVDFEGVHYGHLFLLGLMLFLLTLGINILGFRAARRMTWRA